ncbi:MAG: flbY [Caulobacteraceae bacterium]|nr:flbY [Caulobacteraceae bacterium]
MSEHVEAMIALTERLTAAIAEDAKSFEARKPQEVAARMAETGALANQYRHDSMRLRGAPEVMSQAPMEMRLRLIRVTEAFDAVLARHGRALEAAKTVTEGLVRAIAEEVASQRSPSSGYGPAAKAGDATAITLNQSA